MRRARRPPHDIDDEPSLGSFEQMVNQEHSWKKVDAAWPGGDYEVDDADHEVCESDFEGGRSDFELSEPGDDAGRPKTAEASIADQRVADEAKLPPQH